MVHHSGCWKFKTAWPLGCLTANTAEKQRGKQSNAEASMWVLLL